MDSRRTSRVIVLTVYVSTVSLPVTRVETVRTSAAPVATRKSCVASGAGNPDTWSRIASIDSTRAISRRFTVTSAVRSDICAAPRKTRSLLDDRVVVDAAPRGTWTSRARTLEEDSAVAVPPNSRVSTAASAVTSLASVRRVHAVRPRNRRWTFRERRKPSPWVREARAEAGVGEAAADEDKENNAEKEVPARESTPEELAEAKRVHDEAKANYEMWVKKKEEADAKLEAAKKEEDETKAAVIEAEAKKADEAPEAEKSN